MVRFILRSLMGCALALAGAKSASAEGLVLGVNERIANHHDAQSADIDSIWSATRWLGVQWVRENLVWPEIEEKPDVYRVPRLLDEFIRSRPSNRSLLVVLGFANLHRTPSLPVDGSSQAAYRRYLDYVIGSYAPYVDAWQVWNEPNINGPGGTPPVDATVAATATRLTRAVVDSLDPTALVVGPAILGRDEAWATAYHRTGADTLVDVIAIHYYPSQYGKYGPWAGFGQWMDRLRRLWPGRPIWVTETGAMAQASPSQTAALDSELADADRYGVAVLFWWNLRDFNHRQGGEYSCGLYTVAWQPKPAAFAFRAAATARARPARSIDRATEPLRSAPSDSGSK